jgi:phospholipid/cholesterol/gamma-HCH transport system substrate-binding protein
MNNNRQYLIVGLFVLLTSAILVSVWLWFTVGKRQLFNTYVAVFHEPVDGITTDSVIKYNGVEVGRVKQIALDEKNPRNVMVYLNILQNVPINVDTYATMKPQGITGLAYIDLRLPDNSTNVNNLTPTSKPPYPQIKTQSSFLYGLTEQAQSVTNNVQDISTQMKAMLNEKNIERFSSILANLDRISNSIATRSDKIGQSIDSIAQVLSNVKTNTENLNDAVHSISRLTKTLSKTSEHVNDLLASMQNTTLQNINTVFLPNINQAVVNMNQASMQLEQLLNTLNQNPAMLIRGRAPRAPGPGE